MQGMQATIRRFLDLSMAVASEEQFDRLLPRLLRETVLTAGAATGVLYLADGQRLVPSSALCPDGTALDPQALGQLAAPQMPGPAAPGAGEDAPTAGPLMDMALSEGRVCSRPITAEDLDALRLQAPGLAEGLAHGVAIPLLNRRRECVGAMLLLLKRPPEGAQVSFVAALPGTAAVSLEARALIQEQKQLFEAFIQLIAGAIDAKSPYTGGHCARVPEEFAFVAAFNQGGEYLSPLQRQRLQDIAQRTWTRTLDDALGISQEEAQRRAHIPKAPLPVQEQLLSDKPEHRIERAPQDRIAPGNPWGFRIDVPELLYNRGELHNLQVSRGTLSAEERYKINEHMVQTIKMLARLPFPKHLRAVPEIAGGHHEKMDGTGYPRGLRREDMSPMARMMAVADIFEALTAADRPYKPGKRLSEALHIMARMCREQHIDADVFALFLRAGVYQAYAERYMPPELIDTVQIENYLH